MDVSGGGFVILILVDDVLANPDAFITDEDRRARNEFPNVVLTLVAEGTSQDVVTGLFQCLFPFARNPRLTLVSTLRPLGDNFVDNTIVLCLVCGHDVVTLHILFDPF